MAYKEIRFLLTGVAPLVPHNGQTADPLNPFSKAMKKISAKRKKTDEDYEQLANIEWMAGLYLLDGKPAIPGELIEAMFVAGAKATRRGRQALAGMYSIGSFPLTYKGPQDLDELRGNPDFRLVVPVRIQSSKVIRTRPMFKDWAVEVAIFVNPEVFDDTEITDILRHCGDSVGLCDWRPKFGRFTVSVLPLAVKR